MFFVPILANADLPRVCAMPETLLAPIAAEEWVTLGEIKAFGQTDIDSRKLPERKVAIKFPKDVLPAVDTDAPSIGYGDRRVMLNEWGNLGRTVIGAGGFDEFRQMYENAEKRITAGGSNVWKCKAVIFKETTVLHKRVDGVLETQHATMSNDDITFCLETFARFEALVEAFTDGAIDMQLTFSLETEPVTGYYEGGDTWSLHPNDAGDNYLRGRFNRGDFDCLLYMYHPATTNSYSFGGTLGRTNNATQSYVILSNGREGGARIGHTEAMLHEWFHQIEDTYSRWGYGGWDYSALPDLHGAEANGYSTDSAGYTGWFSWMRDLCRSSVTQGMWAKLRNREEPDYAAVREQSKRSDGKLYRWRDVSSDPWAKLPYLTPQDLATRIGAASMSIEESGTQMLFSPKGATVRTPMLSENDSDDSTLNNELNFAREGIARIGYRDRDLLFVRWDIADFVIEHLADHATGLEPPANVLGYMSAGSKQVVVIDTKLGNDTLVEVNLLSLGGPKAGITALTKGEFGTGEPVRLTLTSDAADMRFAVTDWSGTALTLSEGALSLPQTSGVHVIKATAALPTGERIERPVVIRIVQPVDMELKASGTARVSENSSRLALTLRNHGAASVVRLQGPNNVTGLPQEVKLAPWEKKAISLTLDAATVGAGAFDISIQGKAGAANSSASVSLMRQPGEVAVENTFDSGADGWDTVRADNAGWTATSVAGGFRGNCLEIKDRGGVHWGRVNAFGGYTKSGQRDPAHMGYDLASFPYLDFYLKTNYTRNLGFVVTLADGKRYTIVLTGPYLEQWGESKELPRARFVPNGEWQRIVYDLRGAIEAVAPGGSKVVVDIGFGDTRQFSSNQLFGTNAATHYVDEFRITRNADVASNTTTTDTDDELRANASPTSASPDDRMRAAAAIAANPTQEGLTSIRTLIKDPSNEVRMNAAFAFSRAQDAVAAPLLVIAVKLERDPYAGIMFARAVEKQATPDGFAALAELLSQGRFEELGVAEAALAIGRLKDPKFIPNLAVGITGRSWLTRRDAATAIAMIPGSAAQQTLMTFLLEVDPMVRIAVAKGAKVDIDPVGKRMEWGSVNDLSDIARAYCYAALARSSDSTQRARGYAGLRETNADVRRIVADELQNDSQEYHVQPLLGLLSDPVPEVRAAALQSVLQMPGKRDFSEMSVLSGEDYEMVLVPLLEAAKQKKLVLPEAMLDRLARHRNADVRKLVKEVRS